MCAVGGSAPEAPSNDPNLARDKDNVKRLKLRLVVSPLRVKNRRHFSRRLVRLLV
jgi:hypothetical protein